jgi:polysaccharide export outer membrane protein
MTRMMRRMDTKDANHSRPRRGIGDLWLRSIVVLLLAIASFARSANAQFSGPALDLSTPMNHKLVPTTDPAILYPSAREIVIGQGDLLTIHLYGMADYTPTVRVALDGTIQLPLIGSVAVDGLSLRQAQDLIAKRLSDEGMYRNPQVSIQLVESPNEIVTLTGEMHGVFPVAGGKRLYDVLAGAGGIPPTASHTVVIHRPGIAAPIVVDMGTDPALSNNANVPLFPRDTVVISRVGVVYLLGAFKLQGAIPITQNSPLTLMQLTALGGGAGFEGQFNDLRIIRTTGAERTVVQIDIKKVMKGQDPDPILQADDIVFLPSNALKAAIKVGGLGTLLGLASVLVYSLQR